MEPAADLLLPLRTGVKVEEAPFRAPICMKDSGGDDEDDVVDDDDEDADEEDRESEVDKSKGESR